MRELKIENTNKIEKVTKSILAHISTKYNKNFIKMDMKDRPPLGFLVAGYGKGRPFAEEWEFRLPEDIKPKQVRKENIFGSSWRGIDLPFTRLYMGYDPRIFQLLQQNGVDVSVLERMQSLMGNLQARVMYDGMPVQDAVNFAQYIVKTTIGLNQFEIGPPGCGGPVQMAIILPDSGFEWISEPKLEIKTGDIL